MNPQPPKSRAEYVKWRQSLTPQERDKVQHIPADYMAEGGRPATVYFVVVDEQGNEKAIYVEGRCGCLIDDMVVTKDLCPKCQKNYEAGVF